MIKIGVIGAGVVGGAMLKSFNEYGIEVNVYDKYKNIGSFEIVLDTDVVFLCLPTLYCCNLSEYDKCSIHEICDALAKNNYKGLVVLKSTIEPSTSQSFADQYKLQIIHNPEFLTASTAFEDFHNQSHIVIGKTSEVVDSQVDQLVEFYKKYYPGAEITICTSMESESVKIFCNCFYAVKIQFFNELYLLCEKLGMSYETIKNIMLKNGWINPMHTQVPGKDGKLSYGGMCFPKDTRALLAFMKANGTPHLLLNGAVEEHKIMRNNELF